MNNSKKEKGAEIVFFIFALSGVAILATIMIFIFQGAQETIGEVGLWSLLSGEKWAPLEAVPQYGLRSMIVGSVLVTVGRIITGVPVGILTAVYLAYFCPDKLHRFFNPAINLLRGIPSVIYGFFGMMFIVPVIRTATKGEYNGNSILAAAILLGIMILPTIIAVSQSAIRAVPNEYYQGALALGATKEKSVFSVIVPAARSGVLAAVILGIGRSIGETMAVQMVVGNQPRTTFNILKGIRTMTTNIVIEMAEAAGPHRSALIATGAVLFVFILIINVAFQLVKAGDKNNG